MKKVIFCNTVENLKNNLADKNSNRIRYAVFTYNSKTGKLIKFAKDNPDCFVLAQTLAVSEESRQDFLNKFINFIGNLNIQNRSPFWWCLNFTNKNPITTRLCDQVFNFLSIINLLRDKDSKTILVITDDIELLRQFRIYAKDKEIEIVNAISGSQSIKDIVKRFTPLIVFFGFFRMFILSLYAKKYCKVSLDNNQKYTAILSLLNQQSFRKDGRYHDTYFGDFLSYLKEKEIPFINLLIVTMSAGKYRKTLQNAYSQAEKVPFIAVEYFLGIFDLFGCLFNSLIRYYSPIRLKGDLRMDNFDISYLVKEAIKKDSLSAQFFDTLRIYYAARSMVRKISLSSFYYPFENRSFEKMAVQAIKENAPEAKVVGYQHASLSLSHTNFLLTKEEAKITPLPDTIMTMGRITKDIMKNMGNFPSDLLKTGCALRQKINIEKLKDKKENIRNILVVLATGIEEYVKVLMFLEEAFKGTNQFYNIWIRPHPVFKLEDAIKIIGKPNFTFHKTEKETLSECLEWADAVMYVHSTVAIEALSKGMPVMCINIDNALNADPLFDFSSFKWQVNSPHELETVVNEINTLSEDDFRLRQAKAVEYVKDYFYPVNQDTLAKFM